MGETGAELATWTWRRREDAEPTIGVTSSRTGRWKCSLLTSTTVVPSNCGVCQACSAIRERSKHAHDLVKRANIQNTFYTTRTTAKAPEQRTLQRRLPIFSCFFSLLFSPLYHSVNQKKKPRQARKQQSSKIVCFRQIKHKTSQKCAMRAQSCI